MDCDPEFRSHDEAEKRQLCDQLRDVYADFSQDGIESLLADLPLHADLPPIAVGKDDFVSLFPRLTEATELAKLEALPDTTLTITLYFLQQNGSVGVYVVTRGVVFAMEAGIAAGQVNILKNLPFSLDGHVEATQDVRMSDAEKHDALEELSALYRLHKSGQSRA